MNQHKANGLENVDDILNELENLRSQLVDLEAMAHAAAQALEHLPNIPRPPSPSLPQLDENARRNLDRLQSLVMATAGAARNVLEHARQAIDDIHELQGLHSRDDDHGSRAGEAGPLHAWPGLGFQQFAFNLCCSSRARAIAARSDTYPYRLLPPPNSNSAE